MDTSNQRGHHHRARRRCLVIGEETGGERVINQLADRRYPLILYTDIDTST
jgi:hypothetical protein